MRNKKDEIPPHQYLLLMHYSHLYVDNTEKLSDQAKELVSSRCGMFQNPAMALDSLVAHAVNHQTSTQALYYNTGNDITPLKRLQSLLAISENSNYLNLLTTLLLNDHRDGFTLLFNHLKSETQKAEKYGNYRNSHHHQAFRIILHRTKNGMNLLMAAAIMKNIAAVNTILDYLSPRAALLAHEEKACLASARFITTEVAAPLSVSGESGNAAHNGKNLLNLLQEWISEEEYLGVYHNRLKQLGFVDQFVDQKELAIQQAIQQPRTDIDIAAMAAKNTVREEESLGREALLNTHKATVQAQRKANKETASIRLQSVTNAIMQTVNSGRINLTLLKDEIYYALKDYIKANPGCTNDGIHTKERQPSLFSFIAAIIAFDNINQKKCFILKEEWPFSEKVLSRNEFMTNFKEPITQITTALAQVTAPSLVSSSGFVANMSTGGNALPNSRRENHEPDGDIQEMTPQ